MLTECQKEVFSSLVKKIEDEMSRRKEWMSSTLVFSLPEDFDFSGQVYRSILERYSDYRIIPENTFYEKKLVFRKEG